MTCYLGVVVTLSIQMIKLTALAVGLDCRNTFPLGLSPRAFGMWERSREFQVP